MQDFLNWRTDPLLVDIEPARPNQWFTANELIEGDRRDSFITPENQLLLYPIMIRKNDFITGERILQSFPYILLDTRIISKCRKQSLALAEKTHYYFQGSNYNHSIRDWQKKFISYLEEQQRLPFPLFRLYDDWLDYIKEKKFARFQSARGENFQLPLYLSEDLAYLSGVVMGDGHLAEYFVNIIDSSKEHILNLKEKLEEQFNSKTEFFKQPNAKAWNVNILGKWIVRFFNFILSQPIKERKYPALREPFIFRENEYFRSRFWSGLMDADGTYKRVIGFSSASKQLRSDFSNYLDENNIKHRFYEYSVFGGTTFSITIAGHSRKPFAQQIGSNHPDKQQELQLLLQKKVYRFSPRITTLRKKNSWNEQVQDFSKDAILDGFFNLSLITTLQILDLGSDIKSLRKKHKEKQKELASYLEITPSLLSKYELNKTALPIYILKKILSKYNVSFNHFFSQLSNLIFRSTSSSCQFPLKPEERLLTLIRGLQIMPENYFRVIGLREVSIEHYKKEISDYFKINEPITDVFHNACLVELIRSFCLIRN